MKLKTKRHYFYQLMPVHVSTYARSKQDARSADNRRKTSQREDISWEIEWKKWCYISWELKNDVQERAKNRKIRNEWIRKELVITKSSRRSGWNARTAGWWLKTERFLIIAMPAYIYDRYFSLKASSYHLVEQTYQRVGVRGCFRNKMFGKM